MTYPLMRARHKELDVVHEVPDNDYYRSLGWAKVDDDTPTTLEAQRAEEARAYQVALSDSGAVFDPSAHNAEDVLAHLADADVAERDRVLGAERDGKARKTVLDPYEPAEG